MRFEDSGEPLGVCALLELLLSKLPRDTEDVPIFRRVQARKLGPNEYRGVTIGYSRMSALAKQALELVGEDPKEYGCIAEEQELLPWWRTLEMRQYLWIE